MPRPHTQRRIGLARAISKLGYCSRAQAARLIRDGKVKLNHAVRHDPETPVNLEKDAIEIDGQPIAAGPKTYLMLNKPRNVVTTASDEKGRDTVYSLLSPNLPWLAPVGRLDKASEGLLLLTNDSEWAARITSPETHLEKTYHVQIAGIADARLLTTLRQGVSDQGDFLRVKAARTIRIGQRNTWLEIVLDEGKNRHIRRLLAHIGVEVLRLVRIAVGPLQLGDLPKRGSRLLTAGEKRALDEAMALAPRERSRSSSSVARAPTRKSS